MKKWLAALLVMGMIAAGLTGCGSKEQQATNAPATTDTKVVEKSGGSDLSTIMKSASQVKGMSFEMVSTMTGKNGSMTSNGKLYMSNGKVRMEMETAGMKMITISKTPGEVYMYNPTEKTAMKITTPQQSAELPNEWAKADGDISGLKVMGEEKKDGFDCLVVTTTTGDNAKMWIRKDIGMPVRTEMTTTDGNVVVEYKNYNIGAQPDNLFEIPADTQITTMPNMSNLPQVPK